MNKHILASLSLFALTAGLFAVGCTSTESTEQDETADVAQAVETYNDPSAVVSEVNDNGGVYCVFHLCDGNGEHWIHLENGVFSIVDTPDLLITRGAYRQLVGATVQPDFIIATQYGTYYQAIEQDGMFTFTAP